jgi:arylamine N-acetyltransferase
VSDPVKPHTIERVLERLGLTGPPERSLEGLNAVYRAWGLAVPFDNVRKRIALCRGDTGPLPGAHAEDFFANFLQHGTSGTCWPSSNGLFALLDACGFEARRISASMRDMGIPNHGSVIVRIDDTDYLADSNMLPPAVFPVRPGEAYAVAYPVQRIRAEPVDDSHRIWFELALGDSELACRILEDRVDHAYFLQRYEITRESGQSPFNGALYAQKNFPDRVLSYLGTTRFWKSATGVQKIEFSADELAQSLVADLGLSEEIVDELRELDALC